MCRTEKRATHNKVYTLASFVINFSTERPGDGALLVGKAGNFPEDSTSTEAGSSGSSLLILGTRLGEGLEFAFSCFSASQPHQRTILSLRLLLVPDKKQTRANKKQKADNYKTRTHNMHGAGGRWSEKQTFKIDGNRGGTEKLRRRKKSELCIIKRSSEQVSRINPLMASCLVMGIIIGRASFSALLSLSGAFIRKGNALGRPARDDVQSLQAGVSDSTMTTRLATPQKKAKKKYHSRLARQRLN
jgi:hypothetical protein